MSAPVIPLAYRIGDERLPWSRETFYRWESLGLIKLARVGGKTLVLAATVEDLLAGRIAIPPHPARLRRPEPIVRPHRKPKAAP
jgi:hypothetical protein